MQISGRDRSELSGYGAVWQRAMAIFAVTSMHGLGGHLRHAQVAFVEDSSCQKVSIQLPFGNPDLQCRFGKDGFPTHLCKYVLLVLFIVVVLLLCFVNPTFVLCYFLFKFLKPYFRLHLDALGEHPHISTPHIVCRAINFVIPSINVNPTRLLLRPTSR